MSKFPTLLLKKWFLNHKRELPWREEITPYRVWISEVMLQQTQVAVVIPYFERWMKQFPTVEMLACAPLEEVLKCWEGLGYYSRARNLHLASKQIVSDYSGEIPKERVQLESIKGIGSYTQGAIRSFAFKQKAAAVDGNVMRVLARFIGCEEAIDLPKTGRRLVAFAEELLPEEEPWLVTEGLIELGATVCMKKPSCLLCPIRGECLAFRHGKEGQIPKKSKKQKIEELKRYVAVVTFEGSYLLIKGDRGKVMADLYEFPYCEAGGEDSAAVCSLFETKLGMELKYLKALSKQGASFTRYRATLLPFLFEAAQKPKQGDWFSKEQMQKLPFSSGHRRILNEI